MALGSCDQAFETADPLDDGRCIMSDPGRRRHARDDVNRISTPGAKNCLKNGLRKLVNFRSWKKLNSTLGKFLLNLGSVSLDRPTNLLDVF